MMTTSLREIEDKDHEWLCALHNDPLVLKNKTHPEPITLDQHMWWWNRIKSDPQERRYIFTVNDQAVGLTKFYLIDQINSNCMLGADIDKEHRGKGYAKHMWNLMLTKAFHSLRLHRVSLNTAEFNEVGRHIYDKLGFKSEGRLIQSLFRDGKYYDQIIMYMLREDYV